MEARQPLTMLLQALREARQREQTTTRPAAARTTDRIRNVGRDAK
jgi:hypothetical protein